jgi:glycosyltransferase involved in cell wall biosynthesis
MPENIRTDKRKLLVVSDTSMYMLGDEKYAFGPVVRELEHLSDSFHTITWIGYIKTEMIGDPIISRIRKKNIHLILLPKSGGESLSDKLKILFHLPLITGTIIKQLFRHDCVHTRGPSVPALIAVLLSFIFRQKYWWNKYAGNWNESSPPFFYHLQQRLLNMATHTHVSINGKWPKQKPHLISLENPCLEDIDLHIGKNLIKEFNGPSYTMCFVGALNDDKGVPQIIEMLNNTSIRQKIKTFYFVGDGPKRETYKKMIADPDNIVFCGFKNATEVHEILKQSDFIVLPSKSEGFPKVIAEASCYGCIAIVSDVSCIGQYINETTGYLWDMEQPFYQLVSTALNDNSHLLIQNQME